MLEAHLLLVIFASVLAGLEECPKPGLMLTLLMQGYKRSITSSKACLQGHPLGLFAPGQPVLSHNA